MVCYETILMPFNSNNDTQQVMTKIIKKEHVDGFSRDTILLGTKETRLN